MAETTTALRERLQRRRGNYPAIAERFGFSYSTLSKFANGERGARPSFEFVDSLQSALDELDREEVTDGDRAGEEQGVTEGHV